MSLLDLIHGEGVHRRRVRVLSEHFARLIPPSARVLDVGCGDGHLAARLQAKRPDLSIQGIDVLARPDAAIAVEPFDGINIPFASGSFDVILLVDVLHHTDDPMILLREAVRVARQAVAIKDHLLQGWLAGPTLRLMDWVGNARHGVRLPYHYWTVREWRTAWAELGLRAECWEQRLQLYPPPASLAFERSLHFMALLKLPPKGELAYAVA